MSESKSQPWNSPDVLRAPDALSAENARLKELAAKAARAEEALQLSEVRFRSQFQHLLIPTYIWKWNGSDLVMLEYNDAADAFTQGGVRNFVGTTATKMYGDRPQILAELHRCFNERITFKREMSYRLHSVDVVKDLIVSYVFVPPDIVMVHTDDITESNRALAALRESEERYRALFENAPVGLGVADERGMLLAYNEAMMAPGGYTREDIERIGNVGALYADPAERDAALALARQQGFLRQHVVRFKRKDGSSYIARMSLQPIKLNGQRGWQAMSEDITEQKKAEAALQESEERLRMALEAGAMGVWELDIASKKVIWSEKHARLFGMELSAFEGSTKSFYDCVHPDDRNGLREKNDQALKTRTPFQHEFRIQLPDGSTRWMATFGKFYFDPAGNPVKKSGVTMDITERKQLEAQLIQAQKIESIGRLAGGIAHDFNNLLTGIMGYTELLAMRLPQEFSSDIDGMRQLSARAANLTRQLLGFARKQRVEPRVVNVNTLLSGTRTMLTRLIGAHIEMLTQLDEGLQNVRIDPGQFEQVLLNLVVNASDAMPKGGKLTIRTQNISLDATEAQRRGAAPGQYTLVSVTDTGSGLSDEAQKHLFEPFFTTKEPGKGTGLGLATCYGIIHQHGGRIWAENPPGGGAIFNFILPTVTAPVEAPARVTTRENPRGKETVLLVEDEPTVRSICVAALRESGYSVHVATDGENALSQIGAIQEPALLITDVVMPRLGGRELAEQLRARWKALRVLFISGYTREEFMLPEGAEGRAAFLQKPFTPETLLRNVRSLLDG